MIFRRSIVFWIFLPLIGVFADMLAIHTEPVLSVSLPKTPGLYAIQANDSLTNEIGWVTLAVVSNGVYTGYLVNMPAAMFFRVQYTTNTVPVGTFTPIQREDAIYVEKGPPALPSF